ncbi:MAG: cytochrome c oxidase subunit I [Candidatus Eremiobacteraeota bacterium]|nr:cytochrome c oxidase subunit I [Candidatus Eremiobacteraeota bacterium]
MNTTTAPVRSLAKHGIIEWLTSTDHKHIGTLYMVTSVFYFLVAGVLAMIIRAQLSQPNMSVVGPHQYNEVFTLHGTAMIFLFVVPFALGLGNYLIPLQIGAPDMAFPRLNAVSYWLFFFGGITIFSGVLVDGGAASAGWTAFAPLSGIKIATGGGQDLWIVGLLMTSISGILTAVNFMTTTFLYRAPGMTMWRLPIFTWEMIATSLLILMAFPSLAAVLAMLYIDRHLGGQFFQAGAGGNPILYQHLFWFFGHPEVYIMILPYFGVISEIIPVFSRKPVFGYTGLVLSAFAIAGLSMGVWAHHMFTTGVVANLFFSGVSFLIAVPTGIKFFNWIGTMWKGSIVFTTPMLFAVGFMLNFLIGGISGVMVASPPIDFNAEDSYFLVAHFHYVLGGGSLFAIFGAIYFWFPKVFGKLLSERLGKWVFGLLFVGFNTTFFVMHFLGNMGMPRRVYTYAPLPGWGTLNLIASVGAAIMALGVLLFAWDVISTFLSRRYAGDDPWGGYTLEWWTTSPPPEFNFTSLPPIRSERPVFDAKHPELARKRS